MDATRLLLDTCEVFVKAYSTICRKPYVTVKVRLVPQRDKSGPETNQLIAFTIINESGPDIEVQEAWFLTSFHRRVFSKVIDSKMPIHVRRKDRATYFVPIEELKAALNERVGETITEAAVFDKTQRQHQSRVDEALEVKLAK
jgi:hypothetical protein